MVGCGVGVTLEVGIHRFREARIGLERWEKNLRERSARRGIRKWGLEPRGPVERAQKILETVYKDTYVVCGCRREDWYSRSRDADDRMVDSAMLRV